MSVKSLTLLEEVARELGRDREIVYKQGCVHISTPDLNIYVCEPALDPSNLVDYSEGELKEYELPFGQDLRICLSSRQPIREAFPANFARFYEILCRNSGYMFIEKPDLDSSQPREELREFIFSKGDLNFLIASCVSLVSMEKIDLAEMLVKPYPLIASKIYKDVNFILKVEGLFKQEAIEGFHRRILDS